jgi:hypothetical protein
MESINHHVQHALFPFDRQKTHRIDMLSGGRFVSHHDHAMVYFDSRHRVIQTKLEGGVLGELVEELQPEEIFTSPDWPRRSYRPQLLTVNGGDGVSVIEFRTKRQ